jgi:hypothetical protein
MFETCANAWTSSIYGSAVLLSSVDKVSEAMPLDLILDCFNDIYICKCVIEISRVGSICCLHHLAKFNHL